MASDHFIAIIREINYLHLIDWNLQLSYHNQLNFSLILKLPIEYIQIAMFSSISETFNFFIIESLFRCRIWILFFE